MEWEGQFKDSRDEKERMEEEGSSDGVTDGELSVERGKAEGGH